MQLDLELAKQCKPDEVYFRFYQWLPYCVSLGAHQVVQSINIQALQQQGFTWVKRPTGGRAILHAEELTYSVVTTIQAGYTPHSLYETINRALKEGLVNYHPQLAQVEQEETQPDFRAFYKQESSSAACFASTAKNELKVSGRKLVGSAQRKLSNSLLQHGSILIGKKHRDIVGVLNLTPDQKMELVNELNEKTIEIETVLGELVDVEKLRNSITQSLEKAFALTSKATGLGEFEKILKERINNE